MNTGINPPIFSIGDIVIYENRLYEIRGIYAIDWLYNETFVYGLISYGCSPLEPLESKLLVVREGLLMKATDKDVSVWEILYGKN